MINWTNTRVKLGDLKPWAENPRMSSKAQAKRLLESWREYGQVQTIAISPALEVYDGHQRLSALLTVHGRDYEIDARQSDRALTDDERRRLVVLLHAGAQGAWNWDLLSGWDESLLTGAGMDESFLKQLNTDAAAMSALLDSVKAGGEKADAEPQIDRAAELNKKWQVKPGDLWRIGEHRLLCGDSTKREDVARVMGGEKAAMVQTDPPYGVAYSGQTATMFYGKDKSGKARATIASDDTPEMAERLMVDAFCIAVAPVAFVWCAPQFHDMAKRATVAAKYEVFSVIVWNKNHANFGAMGATYKPKYEMVLACKRDKIPFYGDDNEVTVWDCDRAAVNDLHPTQKPVEIFQRAIRNHTRSGEITYDPFLGSGTTMVACENLGRKCRGIEISPDYCAVILERMQTAFPSLTIELMP